MRVSVSVTNYSWPGGGPEIRTALGAVARAADDAGLDGMWVADHLLQADPFAAPEHTEMLEAYTTLGYLAARTEHVELGTMVTGVTFREPALLIKAVTTLDVLSGGRAVLGVGAGYLGDEARAMGLPLPPTAERFDRLEETLRLAKQMWAGDATAFNGVHYTLDRPVNSPNSIRRPHPPILVGGTGEKRTLPLVARYADRCNVFDIPDGGKTVRHKLAVLADRCAEVGRPYGEIEKTISTRLGPDESGAAFAERCAPFTEMGIDHVCVIVVGPFTEDALARLGEARRLLQAS